MASHGGRRIAALTKNRLNPAYAGARLGMDRVAARFGYELTHHVPEKPDDIDEQRAQLRAVLDERPDGIVLAPAHATALNPLVEEAASAGIPLACFVSRPEGAPCQLYVGSDDYALAYAVASRLLDEIGAGEVVILEGNPNAVTSPPRTRGFLEAVAERPGITVGASRSGYFLDEPARKVMAELLPRLPRLTGILAANDAMALGALAALDAVGRTVPVIGVNAIPEAVQAVKAGRLLATTSFDAMSMACLAVEGLVRILEGGTVPAEIQLPVAIVDRANADRFDRPYEARDLPSWDAIVAAAGGGARG